MANSEWCVLDEIGYHVEQHQPCRVTHDVLFTLLTYTYKDIVWGKDIDFVHSTKKTKEQQESFLSSQEIEELDNFFLSIDPKPNKNIIALLQSVLDNTQLYDAIYTKLNKLTNNNFSQDIPMFLSRVRSWETFEYERRKEEDFAQLESWVWLLENILERYIHASITWWFMSIWNASYEYLTPYISQIQGMQSYDKQRVLDIFDTLVKNHLERISSLYPESWLKVTSMLKPWSNFNDIDIVVLENERYINNKKVWWPYSMERIQVAVARMFLEDEL
jgi:hypothetical protein